MKAAIVGCRLPVVSCVIVLASALGAAVCPAASGQDRLERAVQRPAREEPPVLEGRPVRHLSRDPSEAWLLVKGDGYAIHALAGAITTDAFLHRPIGGGISLIHTDLESGRMSILFSSGVWEVPTRRISYSRTSLLGAAVDDERLYVAAWQSGRVFDEPPSPWAQPKGGQYVLSVHRLTDGKAIYHDAIDNSDEGPRRPRGDALEEAARQLSAGDLSALWTVGENGMKPTEAGNVKLIKGGVSVFGHHYTFDGAELKEKSAAPDTDEETGTGGAKGTGDEAK